MKKKIIASLLVCFLATGNIYPLQAKSFAGREAEMNEKCSVIYDRKTQKECEEYKAYLEEKSKDLSQEISDIKKQLSDVGGNIDKLSEQLKKNNKEINDLDEQISGVQSSIDTITRSIAKLNKQIEEKKKDIEKRDRQMRERLVEMQPYTGSNNFIDFLMGSSSFADLLRRSEILGELNAYESEQIEALSKEREKLNEDKEKVQSQKDMLEVQKKALSGNKKKAEELKAVNEKLIAQYRTQEDKLLDQQIKAQMAKVNMPKIDTSLAAGFDEDASSGQEQAPSENKEPSQEGGGNSSGNSGNSQGNDSQGNSGNNNGGSGGSAVKPSTDFVVPIQGNWYRSAGTWAYPSGNVHRGMDFGTYQTQGLRVVAPASGIIIWTYVGCDSPAGSNYPNSCGVPRTAGNNLTMLTRVNGVVYAFSFYHLSGTAVSAGTTVSQGQTIAYTGNSGNSTGPHCHVEMIKVGTMTLAQALNLYNANGDLSFGVGWGQDPKACGSAPCRLRPENYFL